MSSRENVARITGWPAPTFKREVLESISLDVPPLPDLAPALDMPRAKNDVDRRGILRTHQTRGQNCWIWALVQAREVIESAAR